MSGKAATFPGPQLGVWATSLGRRGRVAPATFWARASRKNFGSMSRFVTAEGVSGQKRARERLPYTTQDNTPTEDNTPPVESTPGGNNFQIFLATAIYHPATEDNTPP